MKHGLILIAAALLMAGATTPDAGHCDSKPFTLKKPATPAPKAAPAPVAAPAAKPAAAKAPTPKIAKSKKYVIGCKQPKN